MRLTDSRTCCRIRCRSVARVGVNELCQSEMSDKTRQDRRKG